MFRRTGLTLGIFALFAGACGDSGGGDDGGGPLGSVDFPDEVDFRRVPIGLEVTESLTFVQQGTGVVELVEVRPGPDFTTTQYEFGIATSLPLEIGRGGPRNLDLTFFSPTDVGRITTSVTLVFSGNVEREVSVQATTDVALDVDLPNNLLDFGRVIVGRVVDDRVIRVTNRLDRPIPIHVEAREGRPAPTRLSGEGEFEVDASVNAEGILSGSPINPSDSLDIPIQYTPPTGGGDVDRAVWRIGACPSLDNECGVDVTLTARPITAPIECRRDGEGPVLEEIDFGKLNPPETATATVTCVVTGAANLDSFTTPGFISTGVQVQLPLQIVPPEDLDVGTEFDIGISFDPTRLDEGDDIPENTRVELNVKDPDSGTDLPNSVILLKGGHGRPVLSASPETLDFQNVRLETSKPDRIFVTNSGPVTFTGRMRIEEAEGTEDGAFTSPTDGTQFNIAPGATRIIDLTFNAQPAPGEKRATVVLFSDEFTDPRNPNLEVSIPVVGMAESLPPCAVDINPSPNAELPQIRFGRSPAKTENRAFVVVKNNQSSRCLMNGIRFSPDTDDGFFLVDPPDEVRLARNESVAIEIGFRPDRPADATDLTFSGTLEFYVSDDDVSDIRLEMSGEQSIFPLVRAPNVVDLVGGSNDCTRYDAEVALVNGDDDSITVQSITLEADDFTTFDLEFGEDEPPYTINRRNGRRTFRVVGRPPGSGTDHRTARVRVSLQDSPTPFIVPVLLRVADDLPVSETFVQAGLPSTEVIFVLPFHADSGGADVAGIQAVASDFWAEFADPIVAAGVDYQVGFVRGEEDLTVCGTGIRPEPAAPDALHLGGCGWVANGDIPPQSGLFSNRFWKYIDGDEGNLTDADVFVGHMTKRISTPFQFDPVLDAAALAVHPVPVSGWNEELLSEDAHLHFVVINNVDDSSEREFRSYVDWLRHIRGQPRRFDTTSSVIVGPEDESCSTGNLGPADPAPNLVGFGRLLGGGLEASVCDADWATKMADAGRAAAGIRRRVQITRPAVPDSVQVFADGVEVPPGPADDPTWTYDEVDRLLTFTSSTSAAVDPGAEVEIRYDPECAGL